MIVISKRRRPATGCGVGRGRACAAIACSISDSKPGHRAALLRRLLPAICSFSRLLAVRRIQQVVGVCSESSTTRFVVRDAAESG